MTDNARPEVGTVPPQNDAPAAKKKRGSGKRGGRGQEAGSEGRQGRPRGERSSMAGFGDGIERAVCSAVFHRLPSVFPASQRPGATTIKLVAVATTGSALLLCDGRHEGPHVWPNGDVVDEASGGVEPMVAITASSDSS
jgi:hypothetical protein